MMPHLLKILTIALFVLIFNSAKFVKAETLEELAGEINDIREQISNLKSSNIEEAVKIDKALKELDRVMNFIDDKVATGDIATAISTLEFAETTVTDIAKVIPNAFKSEITQAGEEFTPDQMKEISKITDGISANKAKKTKALAKSMKEIKSKGLDVQQVSQTINVIGIQTINVNVISSTAAKTVSTSTTPKGSLNKEIEDQEKYSVLLGKSPKEVELKIKQVSVIQSGDAKKHRAFEIEKYGTAAGLSKRAIQRGIDAVYSGNIGLEKKISMNILDKLSKNSDFNVDKVSSAEMDAMMEENIAVEKAANAILNSGINFGAGTNDTAVDVLSKQVANILSGTTDQATIDKITYKISRTKYEIWDDSSHVAANMIAQINGDDQVHALVSIKNDQKFGITESIAEQAARVEAHLSGDTDTFLDAKNSRIEVDKLTSREKSQLNKVYSKAITDQTIAATQAATSAAGTLESASSIAATIESKDLKTKEFVKQKADEMLEASKTFSKTKYVGDGSAWKAAQKEYIKASTTYITVSAKQSRGEDISSFIEDSTKSAASEASQASQAATEASQASQAAATASQAASQASQAATEAAQAAASEASQAAATAAKVAAAEATTEAKAAAVEAATEAKAAAAEAATAAKAAATEAAAEVQAAAAEVAKEVAQEAVKEIAQEVAKEVAKEAASSAELKEELLQAGQEMTDSYGGDWNEFQEKRDAWIEADNKYREAVNEGR